MLEADTDSLIGTLVDRYKLISVLGTGGFGAVYRARHTVLEQDFALKVLHAARAANPAMSQRFLREAKAAAAVGNPHIVQVTDAGTTESGMDFLVMELLAGRGLDKLIETSAPMAPEHVIRVTLAILDGLSAAHSANIVHRDLKPANVFLARTESGEEIPKILDFGISRMWEEGHDEGALTKSGMIMGTPQYMAPEQFRDAKVDARADLYAVACILYQMLSGVLPFIGSRYDEILLAIHQSQPKPLVPPVPEPLDVVVRRGLSRDPDGRWQSADEFSAALARVLMNESIEQVASTMDLRQQQATPAGTPLVAQTPAQRSVPGLTSSWASQVTPQRADLGVSGHGGFAKRPWVLRGLVMVALALVGVALGLLLWGPWRVAREAVVGGQTGDLPGPPDLPLFIPIPSVAAEPTSEDEGEHRSSTTPEEDELVNERDGVAVRSRRGKTRARPTRATAATMARTPTAPAAPAPAVMTSTATRRAPKPAMAAALSPETGGTPTQDAVQAAWRSCMDRCTEQRLQCERDEAFANGPINDTDPSVSRCALPSMGCQSRCDREARAATN